jgi:hypothetical protein
VFHGVSKQVLEQACHAVRIGGSCREWPVNLQHRTVCLDGLPGGLRDRCQVDRVVRFDNLLAAGDCQDVLDDPLHALVGLLDVVEVLVLVERPSGVEAGPGDIERVPQVVAHHTRHVVDTELPSCRPTPVRRLDEQQQPITLPRHRW